MNVANLYLRIISKGRYFVNLQIHFFWQTLIEQAILKRKIFEVLPILGFDFVALVIKILKPLF